jgi:hypothetical protein
VIERVLIRAFLCKERETARPLMKRSSWPLVRVADRSCRATNADLHGLNTTFR